MADNALEQRVLAIEQMLQDYATRSDLEAVRLSLSEQIVQLRVEMRSELSALRVEMRAGDNGLREVIEQRTAEILAMVAAGDAETRRTPREEIRSGDEETRQLMRVLHEEVIARLNTISRG